MKITISASKSELSSAKDIACFLDRAVNGMSTELSANVIEASKADGVNLEVEIPEMYMTGISELVTKTYSFELTNVIRGALGLFHGLKDLMGGFGKDVKALVRLASSMTKVKENVVKKSVYGSVRPEDEQPRPFFHCA